MFIYLWIWWGFSFVLLNVLFSPESELQAAPDSTHRLYPTWPQGGDINNNTNDDKYHKSNIQYNNDNNGRLKVSQIQRHVVFL